MRALSILTALGLTFVAANTAQPEPRQMAVMGVGTSTCAVFANLYKADPEFAEQQFFVWTQGYLSGWNHSLMITGQPLFDLGSLSTERQKARLTYPRLPRHGAIDDASVGLMKTRGSRVESEGV